MKPFMKPASHVMTFNPFILQHRLSCRCCCKDVAVKETWRQTSRETWRECQPFFLSYPVLNLLLLLEKLIRASRTTTAQEVVQETLFRNLTRKLRKRAKTLFEEGLQKVLQKGNEAKNGQRNRGCWVFLHLVSNFLFLKVKHVLHFFFFFLEPKTLGDAILYSRNS